ncbi:hypothetical protein JCM3774_000461 [Rhodotorula dairenensis]
MYCPLPVSIPHVLAPASPASTSANPSTLQLEAATRRSAALDAPRRRLGLSCAVPPRLGFPQLICTGVNGIWSPSANLDDEDLSSDGHPPWVRAEHGSSREADDDNNGDPYRNGLPRNETEAEEWAARRRQQRQTGKAIAKVKRTILDRVDSATVTALPEARVPAAEAVTARTRGHARPVAPNLVTSHFTASKASSGGAASTKKRPAGSPPPAGAAAGPSHSGGSRPPSAANRASKRSPSPMGNSGAAAGHGSNSLAGKNDSYRAHKSSLARTDAVGETETPDPLMAEEVLFERGCTQMELPNPTASSRPPPSSSDLQGYPRVRTGIRTSPAASRAPAPFSSPGLMHESESATLLLNAGLVSTPRPPESPKAVETLPPAPSQQLPSPRMIPIAVSENGRLAASSTAAAPKARPVGPSRAKTTDSVTSGIGPPHADNPRKSLTRLDSPSTAGTDGDAGFGVGGARDRRAWTESLEREQELDEIADFLHQNVSG